VSYTKVDDVQRKTIACGIAFIVFLCVLSGCLKVEITREYINQEYGCALDPPSGWQVCESEKNDTIITFSTSDCSEARLTIFKPYTLSMGLALSTFADDIEETLPEQVDNFSVLFRDERTIGGFQGYEIVYAYCENGSSLKAKTVGVLKTRTVFLLSFVVPEFCFDSMLEVVDESMDSFQII
jgi:hypothetical protein